MEIKIVAVEDRYVPKYHTDGAACADVCAYLVESLILMPGTTNKVPLGFSVALPLGWELQIRSRSGLASKGILVANGIGTIDSDYRGPVCVLLYNSTQTRYLIEPGDRVAQVSLQPTHRLAWNRCSELGQTERGEGGFGSTGK